jgi:hypothetical protein
LVDDTINKRSKTKIQNNAEDTNIKNNIYKGNSIKKDKINDKKNKKDLDNVKDKKIKTISKRKSIIIISIFLLIIIAVLFGAFEFTYNTNYLAPAVNFSTFESNFNSAPNVSIVISANNGTELSYAIDCGVSLIRTLTSSHINHKAPSAINLYVMNKINCTYQQGLGTTSSNYITTSPTECLNKINNPAIFINYSNVNQTIIKPYDLYFSGNAKLLQMCGIAQEITSGN